MQGPLPFHQKIAPLELFTFGNVGGGTTMVQDALVYTNNYILINGLNTYLTFMFYMGPQFAVHELMFTHLKGPDYGIADVQLAQLKADDTTTGWANPSQLIQDYGGADPPTWVHFKNFDFINGVVQRNVCDACVFRCMGALGTPFTAFLNGDPDFGHSALNGGPGIYAVRFLISSKNVGSTGYKAGFSDFGVHRITGLGFM